MKKWIITILILLGAAVLIGTILSANKKANEAKIETVSQSGGAAAIKTAEVSKQDMEMTYAVNGKLAPNRELELKAENTGVITALRVKEGDHVQKGQVLAVIDDKFLSLDLETAEDNYQKLLTDKARYESSFKTGGVTQAELDEINLQLSNAKNRLKETQRRRNDANIKAPISGIINKRHVEVGTYLAPGSPLFDIVEVASLKLKVSVDEHRVAQLRMGDSVTIKMSVFPDESFFGVVTFVAPKADETMSFPVEIQMENDDKAQVKAGMYATAVFDSQKIKNVLLIPRTAFVGSVNNREVYVLEQDTTVSLRTVVPGRISGNKVEVIEGLEEGDQVVTTGQINLTDGAKVAVQQD